MIVPLKYTDSVVSKRNLESNKIFKNRPCFARFLWALFFYDFINWNFQGLVSKQGNMDFNLKDLIIFWETWKINKSSYFRNQILNHQMCSNLNLQWAATLTQLQKTTAQTCILKNSTVTKRTKKKTSQWRYNILVFL